MALAFEMWIARFVRVKFQKGLVNRHDESHSAIPYAFANVPISDYKQRWLIKWNRKTKWMLALAGTHSIIKCITKSVELDCFIVR